MRHFDEDAALARLLVLPRQVFDRVLQRNQIRKKDRKDLRMAFAVMQSMRAPLRPSDQSKLIIGEHVTRTCETGRELLRIQRVAHKNGADLDFELSGEIVSLYDLYLKHGYGPAHQETLYLYRDDKFNNFTPSALSRRMARFLEREIGIPMTGQQFRHVIGFIYLKSNPGDYETVRQLLGHKDIHTTMTYYAAMEMRSATKSVSAFLDQKTKDLAPLARKTARIRPNAACQVADSSAKSKPWMPAGHPQGDRNKGRT